MTLADLLQDPHIVHVEEGEHWEPVDFSHVPGNKERLDEVNRRLMKDLSLGYCVDDFEGPDSADNRKAYTILLTNIEENEHPVSPKSVLKAMWENSLKIEYTNGFMTMIGALGKQYKGPKQDKISTEINRIKSNVNEFLGERPRRGNLEGTWPDYDRHTNFEKLAFVKALKQQVYGVMKLVAEVSK
jgi:hypothetical protein